MHSKHVAEIYNAGWWIRNHRHTADGRLKRDQALQLIRITVTAALADPRALSEPILYAVAAALYDPRDPRFQS